MRVLTDWFFILTGKAAALADYEGHFHPLWLVLFILIGGALYFRRAPAPRGFTGLIGFIFPRSHYLNKSAAVDLFLVAVNFAFLSFCIWLGIDLFHPAHAKRVAFDVAQWLRETFGLRRPLAVSGWGADLAYAFLIFAARDLGWYLSHFIFHRVPALWEFHKVHHSAVTLTPITALRFHLLEMISFHLFQGALAGLAVAGGIYFFGQLPGPVTLFSIPVTALISRSLGMFRHSHIWISYGVPVSYLLISPAMHQLHHSAEGRHLDRNFGHYLSLWDWLAGTLYVPKEKETFRIGLPERGEEEWNSIRRVLWLPIRKFWKRGY